MLEKTTYYFEGELAKFETAYKLNNLLRAVFQGKENYLQKKCSINKPESTADLKDEKENPEITKKLLDNYIQKNMRKIWAVI